MVVRDNWECLCVNLQKQCVLGVGVGPQPTRRTEGGEVLKLLSKTSEWGAGETAQCVKEVATKLDKVSQMAGTYSIEEN